MRRYAGTEVGEDYSMTLAFGGDGDASDPTVADRTLGDVIGPYRSASAIDVVNAVSRAVGTDAAGWRWSRLVNMARGLEVEAAQIQG